VPNGIPGIETRLQILWSKGVVAGRVTANEFVALTSTNHAKMYGLYPKKGAIAVGFDADIVLWDANRKEVIRQDILHHGADYMPYEGLAATGWAGDDDSARQGGRRGGKDFGRAGRRQFSQARTVALRRAVARRVGSALKVRLSDSFGQHIVRQAPMDMEWRAGVRHAEMSHQIAELIGGARRVHIRHIETGDRLLRLLP